MILSKSREDAISMKSTRRQMMLAFFIYKNMEGNMESEDMLGVRIELTDRKTAEKLAARLAELSENLYVTIRDPGDPALEDHSHIIINDDAAEYILPVSELLESLEELYAKRTGKPLRKPKNGRTKLYRLRSPTGGSGLSSVSLVFARLLSGRMGDKVLLIDVSERGRFIYEESEQAPQGDWDELVFRIRKKLPADIRRFAVRDYYGIWILKAYSMDDEILRFIEAYGDFDDIVLSGGKYEQGYGKEILVINAKDTRAPDLLSDLENSEKRIVVRNRDYINRVTDERITITTDELSFRNTGERVMVMMDGEFAMGVEKLMQKAVKEYDYG